MIGTLITALWLDTVSSPVDSVQCLTQAVYHEARGEPLGGQVAVARVILHRVADTRWPDTVCDVVYQPAQFSFTAKPHPVRDQPAYQRSALVALTVYAEMVWGPYDPGEAPALYFFNPRKARPGWAARMTVQNEIGAHIFLTDRTK